MRKVESRILVKNCSKTDLTEGQYVPIIKEYSAPPVSPVEIVTT